MTNAQYGRSFGAPAFEVDSVRVGAEVIVIVSGEIDLCTAPRLAEELQRRTQPDVEVIVDLDRVEFLDCAGLEVLVKASTELGAAAFSVTQGSEQVQRLFELTGMSAVLQVIPRSYERTAA